jgi:hypothetical protein
MVLSVRASLLLLLSLVILLAGCGGGGGATSVVSTRTFVGELAVTETRADGPRFAVQLDLSLNWEQVTGSIRVTSLDASKEVWTGSVTGTKDAENVTLQFVKPGFGNLTIRAIDGGDTLNGTFDRSVNATTQAGTVLLRKMSNVTIDAQGVWKGTVLAPGDTTADPATLNVNAQNGSLASGSLTSEGLTIPVGFFAVVGTTGYDLPNGLGSVVSTLSAQGATYRMVATIKVVANAGGVPAGTYQVDLIRQVAKPTAQMAGIWVGTSTPTGGNPQTLQLQFAQTGTSVSGIALLHNGTAFVTGPFTGTVDEDKVEVAVDYPASGLSRVTYRGTVTAGVAYTGTYPGGSFALAKTPAQVLDLRGAWAGTATTVSAPPITVGLSMNITEQVGAIASGTLTLNVPNNPSGPIYLSAVAGNFKGSTPAFSYDLTISATRITGTITDTATLTPFNVTLNKS